MTISLSDAGKRFNREWIFRHLSYQFEPANAYAIVGPNGSGKSTLLQVIAGSMGLSEGNGEWKMPARTGSDGENGEYMNDKVFGSISICAPYLDVVEEMTATEFLNFHSQFKSLLLSSKEIISLLQLDQSAGKQIRYFSSGMKQRIKLAQAIFSDVPVVLLDEPCTNLDADGYQLYHHLINEYCKNRLVIVSSNDEQEYDFCNYKLKIADYK